VRVVADATDAWTVSPNETLGAVWLLRDRDEVRALTAVCPHLGCSIDLAPDGAGFACPCHDSAFDRDGTRRSGPSPRDMDPVPARVTGAGGDRVVEVELRRFRTGVAHREEIG
jgi:menaquinol-cytochrome c reductase iron-sulfur subunit